MFIIVSGFNSWSGHNLLEDHESGGCGWIPPPPVESRKRATSPTGSNLPGYSKSFKSDCELEEALPYPGNTEEEIFQKTQELSKGKNWDNMRMLISIYNPDTFHDFRTACLFGNNRHASWWYENVNRKNFKNHVLEFIEARKTIIEKKSWYELLKMGNFNLYERMDSCLYSVDESIKWINKIFSHNGMDPDIAIKDLITIVDKKIMKINTLWLKGPPNCGKSLLMESVARSCIYYANNNQLNSKTSQFGMQEFILARIVLLDEVALGSDFKDKFNLLCGGNDTNTDKKHQGYEKIKRTPVILMSNGNIWESLPLMQQGGFKKAFDARHIKWELKEMPELINCNKHLNPGAWKVFLDKYLEPKPVQPLFDLMEIFDQGPPLD